MKSPNSNTTQQKSNFSRKVSPKLRLFANCDEAVCRARAEREASLAMTNMANLTEPLLRVQATSASISTDKLNKGTIKEPVTSARASVFVHMADGTELFENESRRLGNIATVEVPLSGIRYIADNPDVTHIEIGIAVRSPPVILGAEEDDNTIIDQDARCVCTRSDLHKFGKDVLIGVIDVGGIAFAHEDFLNKDNTTRIYRIWDMGGDHRSCPKDRTGECMFDYGAEFTKVHLDAAITTAGEINVSPYAIEPQKHEQRSSHATHVTSIAAGNMGICRNSPIAFVGLDLASEDDDRRRSFYDSTRIVHAIEYLLEVAHIIAVEREDERRVQHGDKSPAIPDRVTPLPISINISLGTNGHAHDGSSAASRWIDNVLATPGRVVSVAAGNAGQEAPQHEGDLSDKVGRIHSSGCIKAAGLTNSVDWIVVGDGIADVSENEMEIWYEPQDRLSVTITTPDGEHIGPVHHGEFIENQLLYDGTLVSVYNELYRPANGANKIAIYLTPWLKETIRGIMAGTWRVSIHGDEIRDGQYHIWIERDDPRPFYQSEGTVYAAYPSFFAEHSNVDSHSISSLACGERILAVGNYDENRRIAHITSSQGPTRTGRPKPEIIAPGVGVLAANGFAPKTKCWIQMTGTSMASPYAAGVAGLMLAIDPTLTAAQIIGIIRRTARPLDNAEFAWRSDSGFGVIAADACLEEALHANQRTKIG